MMGKIYTHLAWHNMRSNRKLYLPYLLTCSCLVMIFYIISFLTFDKEVAKIGGGNAFQALLYLGIYVIGIFSVIFLFYTSSFITKQRKKEFGIYHVLGMEKRHIAGVMAVETLMLGTAGILSGLLGGVIFSKLAQLVLFQMLKAAATMTFSVSWKQLLIAAGVFALIFFLVYLNGLRQLRTSGAIQLIRGSSEGERVPKSNYLLAILGILLLGAGYFLAVNVKDALDALTLFFAAVLLVILGTYCCFIAGSVALLGMLKKNKKYYYKTNHFISVSGMRYRMKKNGAGLATICILSTMVLVTLSSVTCLYMGAEDAIRSYYPYDVTAEIVPGEEMHRNLVKETVSGVLADHHQDRVNVIEYRSLGYDGSLKNDTLFFGGEEERVSGDSPVNVSFYVLEDYNRIAGTDITLEKDQILVKYDGSLPETLMLGTAGAYRVKAQPKEFPFFSRYGTIYSVNSMSVVVADEQELERLCALVPEQRMTKPGICYTCEFNLDCGRKEALAVFQEIRDQLEEKLVDTEYRLHSIYGYVDSYTEFFSMYASLMFLGVLLGVVFLVGAILIMYYKQVTEGYDDQQRYGIMQKVGMTKEEIKKSVNSQVLTVFFLPLLMAGLHLAFAFPMVKKLLELFALTNTGLFLTVTLVSFGIFSLLYILVYLITSRAYYKIVT